LKISKMRGLAAGAVTALVVLGSGVSAASAAPALWNTPGSAVATTTAPFIVKVKASPTNTVTYTCAPGDFYSLAATASNPSGYSQGALAFSFEAVCPTTGGLAHLLYYGTSGNKLVGEKVGGAYSLRGLDSAMFIFSGNGGFWSGNPGVPTNYTVPWTNGANPLAPVSTATFNNTQVGATSSGQPITLTGVVRFKTSANGLLNLI
jgi:hypothetical protein